MLQPSGNNHGPSLHLQSMVPVVRIKVLADKKKRVFFTWGCGRDSFRSWGKFFHVPHSESISRSWWPNQSTPGQEEAALCKLVVIALDTQAVQVTLSHCRDGNMHFQHGSFRLWGHPFMSGLFSPSFFLNKPAGFCWVKQQERAAMTN